MKALLIKDWYVISRSMRFFLIILLLFALLPGMNFGVFALVYTIMLPVNAMAFDERAKWDRYAGAMPFSRRTMVVEKYVLGYLSALGAMGFMGMSALIGRIAQGTAMAQSLALMPMLVGSALILQAFSMPIMFKMGVEKGRPAYMIMIVLAAAFIAFAGASGASDFPQPLGVALSAAAYIVPLVALIAQGASIWLSMRIYAKKEL
ncbi:MAG: ABC-2 transporter permease [Clostridia bacterium]